MVFGAILNKENQKKHEKRASILKLIVEGRSDSGSQLPALAALAEASPEARLKPYFSRACPQDDVSSTRQTPSNYYYYYYYYY